MFLPRNGNPAAGKWYNAGAEERKEVALIMNFKIVSGGQTGVDRAGLEAAIALGLPYGGWVPKGRLAEDGVVPLKYAGMPCAFAVSKEQTSLNISWSAEKSLPVVADAANCGATS